MKNANVLYERLKGKGKIAERALKILNESGKLTNLGRAYNLRYVYYLAKLPGTDNQADLAIIQACEDYLAEIEARKNEIRQRETEVIEKLEAVFG